MYIPEELIAKLNKGQVWMWVGSGISIPSGYPSTDVMVEKMVGNASDIDPSIRELSKGENYTGICQIIENKLGRDYLIKEIKKQFQSVKKINNDNYEIICRWPIDVYLTTNFDNELVHYLTKLSISEEIGLTFTEIIGVDDGFLSVNSTSKNTIVKLHGDFNHGNKLVITSEDFKRFLDTSRNNRGLEKLKAILSTQTILVIGSSLSDENAKYLINFAKENTKLDNPIYWITDGRLLPDDDQLVKDYRIETIRYQNSDGSHSNLIHTLRNIDKFVSPRDGIEADKSIANLTHSEAQVLSSIHVYNSLLKKHSKFDKIGIVPILTEFILTTINKSDLGKEINIDELILRTPWPKELEIKIEDKRAVVERLCDVSIGVANGITIKVNALPKLELDGLAEFSTCIEERLKSYEIRMDNDEFVRFAFNTIISLFYDQGITICKSVMNSGKDDQVVVPPSFLLNIKKESIKIKDRQDRANFISIVMSMLLSPTHTEISFLTRIIQAHVAINSVAVIGGNSRYVLETFKSISYLLDANILINVLALETVVGYSDRKALSKLKSLSITTYTTYQLIREVFDHIDYAEKCVSDVISGKQKVDYLIKAAQGEYPHTKRNAFIDGYLRWLSVNKGSDWDGYLAYIFGEVYYTEGLISEVLFETYGIKTIKFAKWSGYRKEDDSVKEEIKQEILRRKYNSSYISGPREDDIADAEAGAYLIIKKLRTGNYTCPDGAHGKAYFVSNTKVLDSLFGKNERTTIPTGAFTNEILFHLVQSIGHKEVYSDIIRRLVDTGYTALPDRVLQGLYKNSGIEYDVANIVGKYEDSVIKRLLNNPDSIDELPIRTRARVINQANDIQTGNKDVIITRQAEVIADLKNQLKKAIKALKEIDFVKLERKKNKSKRRKRKSG